MVFSFRRVATVSASGLIITGLLAGPVVAMLGIKPSASAAPVQTVPAAATTDLVAATSTTSSTSTSTSVIAATTTTSTTVAATVAPSTTAASKAGAVKAPASVPASTTTTTTEPTRDTMPVEIGTACVIYEDGHSEGCEN